MFAKLLIIFALFAIQPGTALAADDVIFNSTDTEPASLPRIFPPLPPGPKENPDEWLLKGNRILVEIVQKFLGGLIPDQQGVEHPGPDENAIDFYTKRLGHSNFQFLLLGAGNLKSLAGPYLYSEVHGGVGVEYDFASPEPDGQGTYIALRFTPVYGEIAVIRTAAGAAQVANLPGEVLLGSTLGFEISRRMGRIEPGIRAYATAEIETGGRHETGMGYYGAIYCKFHLKDLYWYGRDHKGSLDLMPVVAYYDRGGGKDDLYDWHRAHDQGVSRNVGDLRRFVEAQLKLEVKF